MAAWPTGDSVMAARIRAHDWAATPLGPIDQWSAELRIAASLVIENNFPSALVWGPDLVTIYNDGFLTILGDKTDTLGRSFAVIWREAWDQIGPIVARAMSGQSTFIQDYRLTIDRKGAPEEAFFTFSYSPVRGPDGAVLGMIDTVIETTAEVRSRSTLRESEARHRLLIESWTQAVWETDATGLIVKESPSWRAYTGQTLDACLGYGWLDAIHPDDRAFAERQCREAMAARGIVDAEFRLRAPDGGWRWTNVRAAPLLDGQGAIEKWVGVNIDIDARTRAEQALQESEQRQAFLLTLSDVLRPVADPVEIQETATRMLGEQIKASRVFYVLVEEDEDTATILANYTDGVPARLGRYSLSAFSSYAAGEWRGGRTASTDDVDADPQWSETERAAYASVSTRAGFGVPLIKEGRLVALLGVNQSTPRHWTDNERELAREVAERTWAAVERARAETALRRSEERLRALFESIDEGFSEMQVILDEEGHVVDWLHLALNANFSRVTGIPDITGRLASEVFPNLEGEWFRRMDLAYRTGEPQRFETELADLDRWFDNYITRLGSGDDVRVLGVFGDITKRKLAERTLRESEARFQQFANASSGALWIRNADTLNLEYISQAVVDIYGLQPDDLLGPLEVWAAKVVPEDREAALAHIQRVRDGETEVHEFRIQRPADQAFRWVRNTGFPLRDDSGRVQRVGGIFEDFTEAKLAVEHQDVLLAELQHRVRNIMAMIRSMALRTADGALDIKDYRSLLEGRLMALARVQVLLTREANAGGSLRDILASEVSAQAHGDDQFELDGPDIRLSPKAVEVLTLAFHELATNALKYGAFSTPEGCVRVSWAPFEKGDRTWLALDWTEEGAPPRAPPTRRGFGSDLIEGRIPYELGGSGKVVLGADGAHCRLEFPLKEGESILETDAPKTNKLFGGTLDMTGAPDLTGRRVLIVEDDYYMAGDTAAALRGAGAEVLGPCPTEEAAFDLLEGSDPTHAVLDLNLGGGGPRFEIAHTLRDRGVPFIFLSGYDPEVIPATLADVVRLQKPVPFRRIIEAIGAI